MTKGPDRVSAATPEEVSSSKASRAIRSIGVSAAMVRAHVREVACSMKRARNAHSRGSGRTGMCSGAVGSVRDFRA